MLFYLFSSEELCRLSRLMGYDFDPKEYPGATSSTTRPNLPRFDAEPDRPLLGARAR